MLLAQAAYNPYEQALGASLLKIKQKTVYHSYLSVTF
jgi:hypothetical protein